nr:ribonuclease H-like domain, reverse transcriptase, RNA-dependent DNA polymerase [Tanacetum cinerariifolium]
MGLRKKKDERGIVIKNKARRIKEEAYVCQPLGFEDPDHPDKVNKVVKAVYGLHQAPRAWLMKDKFMMSSIGELTFFLGLQVKQKEDRIFTSQDKYVAEVLRKFNFSDVKFASNPMDMEKTLVKDADDDDVDVHLYKSMIGSLMYLTASRPDIISRSGHRCHALPEVVKRTCGSVQKLLSMIIELDSSKKQQIWM